MNNTITLRKTTIGGHTYRPFWNVHKAERPNTCRYLADSTYQAVSNTEADRIQWLAEIGSDMGRSTAWLSNIAQNIDVYEQDTRYIELCKQQCARQQDKYGPIRNINWIETDFISTMEVLESLPKKYDAIKISANTIVKYLPTLMTKINEGGTLILDEWDRFLKPNLIHVLQQEYGFISKRWDSATLVVRHK
jgi:protein-L-isoaspartate O-methyltransferase